MRSSPKFSHEPINEAFYEWALSGNDGDVIGDGDTVGIWERFDFPNHADPDLIDEYNANQSDFEDQINAAETIMLCTQIVGAILREQTDGFVSADLFTSAIEFGHAWQALHDEYDTDEDDE